ncbi:MAG: phosphoribosylformylglycinamidine synthase I [Candidatus Omnitrophica bacterium]|nr:phosphoribosylformylglycinamidine synthase I [Candidatus Omnitrophota bacterium]
MSNPRVIILRTAGTNCDQETASAFREFGAEVDLVHMNLLFSKKASLEDYHILAIPGGFTYGDDIISGRILANELRLRLGQEIQKFIDDGKLIIGICNGFQVLVRAGILPGPFEAQQAQDLRQIQKVTLTYNDSGRFEDRWVHLHLDGKSAWTQDLGKITFLPVAHAEGKFVPADQGVLNKLNRQRQVVFRYCDVHGKPCTYPGDPNGSVERIAAISDPTGRILGMMPHPERHFWQTQHPFWTRLEKKEKYGEGARIFENGVRYVREKLLAGKEAVGVKN